MSLPDEVLDCILSFLQSDLGALKATPNSFTLSNDISMPTLPFMIPGPRKVVIIVVESANSSDTSPKIHTLRTTFVAWKLCNVSCVESMLDIAPVLRMCSLLNKITLGQFTSEWSSLPETFRLAFLDRLHLSSMKTVCITYASGFPLDALNYSKNLKSLTLRQFATDSDFIPTHALLENLSIGYCNRRSMEKIITWVQTRSLEFLTPELPHEVVQLRSVLSSSSNTLRNLSINIGTGFNSYYEFQMGSITSSRDNLSNIPISLSVWRSSPSVPNLYSTPIETIQRYMDSAPPFPRLHILKLLCPFNNLLLTFVSSPTVNFALPTTLKRSGPLLSLSYPNPGLPASISVSVPETERSPRRM